MKKRKKQKLSYSKIKIINRNLFSNVALSPWSVQHTYPKADQYTSHLASLILVAVVPSTEYTRNLDASIPFTNTDGHTSCEAPLVLSTPLSYPVAAVTTGGVTKSQSAICTHLYTFPRNHLELPQRLPSHFQIPAQVQAHGAEPTLPSGVFSILISPRRIGTRTNISSVIMFDFE